MLEISSIKYSPIIRVSSVEITDNSLTGDALLKDCDRVGCIILYADDIPIYASKVTPNLLDNNTETNKGSFTIHRVRDAYAIGDHVYLKCAVGNRTLYVFNKKQDFVPNQRKEKVLCTVEELLNNLNETYVSDMDEIGDYAWKYFREHGPRKLVDATYRMFLRRDPEEDAYKHLNVSEDHPRESIVHYLMTIYMSEEASRSGFRLIPTLGHEYFNFI